MRLTPREQETLLIYVAADVARKRRERGLKLNYPECVALIAEAVLEAARDGKSVPEAAEIGQQLIAPDEVMEGVAEMLSMVQVEGTFPDGTKLVTCHNAIGGIAAAHDAQYITEPGEIDLNPGRRALAITVANTGDRPIQVGSHAHFYEVNKALAFERDPTLGMHLDIPSGTAVRFEPGDTVDVTLVEFGGRGKPSREEAR